MCRRNRSINEQERRVKIREPLQESYISSIEDIKNLSKETIAVFLENGLDAEHEDELLYSGMTTRTKAQMTAVTVIEVRICRQASEM